MIARTPKEVIDYAKKQGVQFIDLKFEDLPGLWQHFTITWNEFNEALFEEGIGFDGSSIRGFQTIDQSDMLLVPDPNTAWIDPFMKHPTLSLICNVKDPVTGERYTRDPRYVAQKAENYLKSTGIADISYFGPEAEFFIFDDIRFGQTYNQGYYYIDSKEGFWNSGKEENPNLGYKPRYKEGYFPVPPMDSLQDIRSEIVETLEKIGIPVEVQHHEVATAGQGEIDMRFTSLTDMADRLMTFKYVVKNVARRNGKTATFMPKPIFMDNGSGMHVHQSLWKDGKNLFYQSGGYADISQTCKYYIGGLLKHAHAVLAFAAPTTNSYRRLVPGYEAPVNLAYSQRNRSACVRIPMYSRSEKAKRIEFRCPDPSCNAYLAFAAMLMAGLDGIQNKIDPGDPLDKDIYDLEPEEAALVETVPGSLEEALDALEKDHDFLMKGEVFTEDVLETWLSYKRQHEVDAIRLRPHPYEFALYFDI
ncbi:MAG TPA: type I glutamate--ammonia ligase [Candidatus Limnocylindrales bacterium]|nr:type I glutamate--ammonia ligase [Candidatus Limnocylindrales bacterium]